MKFDNFAITKIGDVHRTMKPNFARVVVSVSFFDEETKAYSNLEIDLPLNYDRAETLDAIRQRAYEKAAATIAAANDLLAGNPLQQLQQRSDELEARSKL